MENKKNINAFIKRHYPYILLIIVLCLLVYNNNLKLTHLPMLDPITYYYPRFTMIKESYVKYKDVWPLWQPYVMSGEPLFAKAPTLGIDSLLGILNFFSPKVPIALNLDSLITIILAGIFMYFLIVYLTKEPKAGLVSAFIFMFNGFIQRTMIGPGYTTLNAYFFMPLIFLFSLKALKSKKWVMHSSITGILFALQIKGGPDLKVSMWTALIFIVLLASYSIGKNLSKRLVRVVLIGLIVSVVLIGLNAQKILPSMELLKTSSKEEINWERVKEEKTPWSMMFTTIVEPIYEGMPKIRRSDAFPTHVGVIPFILACYAIFKYRKKRVILSLATSFILLLLIINISPLYYLLWKYIPLFKSFRHLYRAIIGIVFIVSVLAGYGTLAIIKKTEERYENKKKTKIAYTIIIFLLLLNIVVFNISNRYKSSDDIDAVIARNYIMQYINKQPGIFRIQTYETRGIDWGTEFTQVPLGIQHIYGYDTEWYPPYFNVYLGIANQQPAKFWGILNTKYMTSLNPVNVSGFRFLKEFERCNDCYPETNDIQKAFGKYLYENQRFIPRAYFVDNSIVVIGEENAKIQTIYSLMLDDRFMPYNTVIIKGKESINEYGVNDLKKYSAVMLTQGSINERSGPILKAYVDNGGVLMPDVIGGKTSIDDNDLNEMWGSFKGSLNAVDDKDYVTHSFDKYELKLNGRYSGFLVLSEKFSVFPGWTAKEDDAKKEILNADGMISSVYMDKPVNNIIFEYKPKSYIFGRNITIATIVLLMIYFGCILFKKRDVNNV